MDNKKKQITTERLDGILKQVKSEKDIREYMGKYTEDYCGNFSIYLNNYIAQHGLNVAEIIKQSNISRNYVYNIINGNRNPGRDKVIALGIGSGMDYREINRALKIAKLGVLYPKEPRDARIIVEINKGVKSVMELNLILEREGFEIIQ